MHPTQHALAAESAAELGQKTINTLILFATKQQVSFFTTRFAVLFRFD